MNLYKETFAYNENTINTKISVDLDSISGELNADIRAEAFNNEKYFVPFGKGYKTFKLAFNIDTYEKIVSISILKETEDLENQTSGWKEDILEKVYSIPNFKPNKPNKLKLIFEKWEIISLSWNQEALNRVASQW